jgi:hypothetical protein
VEPWVDAGVEFRKQYVLLQTKAEPGLWGLCVRALTGDSCLYFWN